MAFCSSSHFLLALSSIPLAIVRSTHGIGGKDGGPGVKSKQDSSPRFGSALTLEEPASSLSLEIPHLPPEDTSYFPLASDTEQG